LVGIGVEFFSLNLEQFSVNILKDKYCIGGGTSSPLKTEPSNISTPNLVLKPSPSIEERKQPNSTQILTKSLLSHSPSPTKTNVQDYQAKTDSNDPLGTSQDLSNLEVITDPNKAKTTVAIDNELLVSPSPNRSMGVIEERRESALSANGKFSKVFLKFKGRQKKHGGEH
jgi:hypothetical protein